MKSFYIFLALLFLNITLKAQSFNYEEVTVKYKLAAKTPFKTDFQTITVRFHGDEHLKRYGLLASELSKTDFKFERFKNKPSQGDLHLDVFVGQPEYLGVERQKASRKVNEVDVPYYYYRGTVITPISYELRDGARNLIEEKIMYTASDHIHFNSDSYNSISELTKVWEESQNIIVSKKIGGILQQSLWETASSLKDRFDDQILEHKLTMFDLKKADKINAEFINTAFVKIQSSLAANQLVSSWQESDRTAIKDLLVKGTKFGTDDNDERVAYAIAHYNLAILNALWGDAAAAKSHIVKGKLADRKIYEFETIEKFINTLASRGVPDDLSSKEYVATFQEGSDQNLPVLAVASKSTGSVTQEFTATKERSIDTVKVKNGDLIIGFVTAVHKMRKLSDEGEIHDFTHLLISPLNMPQKEIEVGWDEIVYLTHKNIHMVPLVTKIALSVNPPIHLYENLQLSKDGNLGLMRTAYHESMPYTLSDIDARVFLYMYKPKGADEFEMLPVSAGSRYILGLNGALAKDFAFCSGITSKANNKHYKLTAGSLKELVDDYDKCTGK